MTAQLIDASNGAHVWAERFDGELSDVFELQDEVTLAVVGAIEPALFKAEAQHARSRPPENLDAWSATMRALGYFVRAADPAGRIEAQKLLRRAIDLAPNYALPKALLSWTTLWDMSRGWLEADSTVLTRARDLAHQAIACDDDEAWGHMALGIYLTRVGELRDARSAFQEALDRNPSFALARGFLGAANIYLGDLDEGRRHLLETIRLSPNDPLLPMCYSGLSSCVVLQGHYEQAIDWASKAVRLNASYLPGIRNLVVAQAASGDLDRAHAAVSQLLALDPTFTVAKFKETGRSAGPLVEFAAHWLLMAGVPAG
jgi:tetratricopeptide (TPR) repeat protein